MSNKVYDYVTDRIIAQIEQAIETGEQLPWQKPWRSGKNGYYNYVSGHEYSGVNTMILDPGCKYYLTFNQIRTLQKKDDKISLRKGSKSLMVTFWKRIVIEEEKNGKKEEKIIPMLRYYNVFRASDVDNLPVKAEPDVKEDIDPIAAAEDIKKLSVCNIKEVDGANKAFYNLLQDYIQVPVKQQYKRIEAYYGVLFHEMVHSTGHESRLDRLTKNAAFGRDDDYSKEELTAEIGSSILRAAANIDYEPEQKNTKAYLLSWLKALRDDTTMIIRACGKAQKAVDYILGGVVK